MPFTTLSVDIDQVLQSFCDQHTDRVWRRQRSKRLDPTTQRATLGKLLILDAAEEIGAGAPAAEVVGGRHPVTRPRFPQLSSS